EASDHKYSPGDIGENGEPVHERDQRDTVEQRTGEVELLTDTLRPFALEFPDNKDRGDDRDGHVDIENAPPSEDIGQDTPEERPQGKPEIDGSDVNPQR